MFMKKNKLTKIYQILLSSFGKQNWWPTKTGTPFEIMIGAILTQQASWNSVEKAIDNLEKNKLLTPLALAEAEERKIEELIKTTGFYKQKTQRIIGFSKYLVQKYNGIPEKMLQKPINSLREELLSIKGVGKETADSIILYAAKKPIFVIDEYTKRLVKRLKITELQEYDALQEFFTKNLPKKEEVYNEFHALIVKLNKENCNKKLCSTCPIKKFCKEKSF